MRRLGRPFFAAVLVLAVTSCNAAAPAYSVYQLPSGRHVKVIGVGKMSFSKGDPALMLKYQTDLTIQEAEQLRREVDEIWQVFRVDVERAGMRAAIISANEAPRRFLIVTTNKSYNFVIQRTHTGNWEFLSDQAATRKGAGSPGPG